MTVRTSDPVLGRFSRFLAAQMGLYFPAERDFDLERGMEAAAKEFGFDETNECIDWLMSSPLNKSQIEILASNLTVGETYFFREPRTFEVLEREVLPAKALHEGRLRIWSAACCSGEEPYSIAIAAQRAVPGRDMSILGSDINPTFLRKAAKGRFSEWSFRNAPDWLKARHFNPAEKGAWDIRPEIRRMVCFSHINLAKDAYPSPLNGTSALDIIFCRNVLIYFSQAQARKVIRHFERCLNEGGWLILGLSESALARESNFTAVQFDGVVLYRKDRTNARQIDLRTPLPPPAVIIPPASVPVRSMTPTPTPIAKPAGDFSALLGAARAAANAGNLAEALERCDEAIAVDKLSPVAHYLQATVLQEQGKSDEASIAFGRAIYLDGEFAVAHFARGNLARASGQDVEARKHFENALDVVRAHPGETILAESDGITAARLSQILSDLLSREEGER